MKTKLKKLKLEGIEQFQNGQYAKTIELYEQSLAIAREIPDDHQEGGILLNLGITHHNLTNYTKAIECFEHSSIIAQKVSDRELEGKALNNIGTAYRFLGNNIKAISYFEQSLSISQKNNYSLLEGLSLENLGITYFQSLRECQKAIEYYQLYLAFAKKINDQQRELYALSSIGSAYFQKKDYIKALEYYEQGLEISKKLNDQQQKKYFLGSLGETYKSIKEYKKAISSYQGILAIAVENKDKMTEVNTLKILHKLFEFLGDHFRKEKCMRQSLDIHKKIFKGNYIEAYQYCCKYQFEKSKIFATLQECKTEINDSKSFIKVIYARLRYKLLKLFVLTFIKVYKFWFSKSFKAYSSYQAYRWMKKGIKKFKNEKFDIAFDFFNQALIVYEGIEDNNGKWQALDNLAITYYFLGEYNKSIDHYHQCLVIMEEIKDDVFRTEGILVSGYMREHDKIVVGEWKNYSKAIEYYHQCLVIAEKMKNDQEKGEILGIIGSIYFSMKNYPYAIEYLQKSFDILHIIQKQFSKLQTLVKLNQVYNAIGNHPQAINYGRQAFFIMEEEFGIKLNVIEQIKLNVILKPARIFEKANHKKLLRKILRITSKDNCDPQLVYFLLQEHIEMLDNNFTELLRNLPIPKSTSNKMVGIAMSRVDAILKFSDLILDFSLGNKAINIEIAIVGYKHALQFYTKKAIPLFWAKIQGKLANAYANRILGDNAQNIEQAILYQKNALNTLSDYPDTDDISGLYKFSLGMFYCSRIYGNESDNLKSAIKYLEESLRVLNYEEDKDICMSIQIKLGFIYSSFKNDSVNLEIAINLFTNALQICNSEDSIENWFLINLGLFKCFHHDNISSYDSWNVPENFLGILEKNINYFQRKLKILERGSKPNEWAELQAKLGMLYIIQKKVTFGFKSYRAALEIYTPSAFPKQCFDIASIFGEMAFLKRYWKEAIEGCSLAIVALENSREWETVFTKQKFFIEAQSVYNNIVQSYINIAQPNKAIEYVERSKSRNLIELINVRNHYPKGNISAKTIKRLKHLRLEIIKEQGQFTFTQLVSGNVDSVDQTRLSKLQHKLDELIKQDIEPIDPTFSMIQKVQSIKFQTIKQLLPDEQTVFIEWYFTKEQFTTFVITNQHDVPLFWQFSSKEIENLYNFVENEYLYKYYNESSDEQPWSAQLSELIQNLSTILRLDEMLLQIPKECDKLILIPYGFLHILPIHALPIKNFSCLMERFPRGVSYAPSCQMLKISRNMQFSNFTQLFAIQNPTQDIGFTEIEVDTILRNFEYKQVIAGKQATKKAVVVDKANYLHSSDCVHFSCHGKFDFISTHKTGLKLADKLLTMKEIFGFDLHKCYLVTLSACETGLTDSIMIGDEYVGLPSAFLYAGCTNVVSSLWKVNDISSAFLMIKFYQNMKKNQYSVAKSLNKAQCWLRDATQQQLLAWANQLNLDKDKITQIEDELDWYDSDEKPFNSPYYWAAFCAIGQ